MATVKKGSEAIPIVLSNTPQGRDLVLCLLESALRVSDGEVNLHIEFRKPSSAKRRTKRERASKAKE